MNASIWKDTYYTIVDSGSGLSPFTYYITENDTEIFRGKAYEMPFGTGITININKICKDWLSNDIEGLLSSNASAATASDACKEFKLYDEFGVLKETYNFLYDWSYDNNWTGTAQTLSRPINSHYDARQYKLNTTVNNSKVVTNYKQTGAYTDLSCGDYCLYYLNRYGGWDAYLIENKTIIKDNITRNSISTDFNNQTIQFEKSNFNNQTTRQYAFNTGFLTDEQSHNLATNLIPSIRVYLHVLNTNKIVPVVITDTNVEYKTFRNNKMFNYTINCEESQSKINI